MAYHDSTVPVLLRELAAGDIVQVDEGYECMVPWSYHDVYTNPKGELYIHCKAGKHFLHGQVDFDDPENKPLVGLRQLLLIQE